jgi:Zn-dependent protease with chaperone function
VHPEVVLVLLVFLTAAPAAMLAGGLHNSRPLTFVSPRDRERACWKEVWIPLLPGVAIACVMGGWAIAEPVPADEPVTPMAVSIACPFALVWCRAFVRAVASWLLPPAEDPLAATVGLFRPTIVLSPVLRGALDPDAFAAVRAHEVAHAAHYDPLRIWLAQLATDLQWPSPAAQQRFRDWRRALEMARDQEVRRSGVDGSDLAAGILAVLRIVTTVGGVAATLIEDESSLRERIQRLLAPATMDRANDHSVVAFALVLSSLAAALIVGMKAGDPLVAALLNALA